MTGVDRNWKISYLKLTDQGLARVWELTPSENYWLSHSSAVSFDFPTNNDDDSGEDHDDNDDDSGKENDNNYVDSGKENDDNDDDSGEDYDDDENSDDQLPTHLWAQLLVEPFSTGGGAITENNGSNKFPAT